MLNDYKFRGRSCDGTYHSGMLSAEADEYGMTRCFIRDDKGTVWEVAPDSVGQYTHRKDMHGIEVYEKSNLVYEGTLYTVKFSYKHSAYIGICNRGIKLLVNMAEITVIP